MESICVVIWFLISLSFELQGHNNKCQAKTRTYFITINVSTQSSTLNDSELVYLCQRKNQEHSHFFSFMISNHMKSFKQFYWEIFYTFSSPFFSSDDVSKYLHKKIEHTSNFLTYIDIQCTWKSWVQGDCKMGQ